MLFRSCLIWCWVFECLGNPLWAQVSGRVTLQGDPLYPDAIVQGVTDKHCLMRGPVKSEDWKIGADRGLGDVVVSVEKVPAGLTVAGVKKIEILQEGCRYLPHVSALQVGGVATIKNGDETLHNVRGMIYFGKGKASKPLFNVGQPLKGMKMDQPFGAPGIYRLNCDVHPWMESWVLVVANPFFAVTDNDGKFRLPDGLPDGDYTLKGWHSRFREPVLQKFTVAGGASEMSVIFDANSSQ